MAALADLERRVAALDARLLPIARQPLSLDDPDALESLLTGPSPTDQAGLRPEADIGMGMSVHRLLLGGC